MEVFSPDITIPFHHLPMTQESKEFPSYSLGSIKTCVLQEKVAKVIRKGVLEEVESPELGFCNSLFEDAFRVPSSWEMYSQILVVNDYCVRSGQSTSLFSLTGSVGNAI